jgi:hypothetical protein
MLGHVDLSQAWGVVTNCRAPISCQHHEWRQHVDLLCVSMIRCQATVTIRAKDASTAMIFQTVYAP